VLLLHQVIQQEMLVLLVEHQVTVQLVLLVVLEDQKVACVAVTCGRLRTYIRQQGFDCHIVMEENHEPHYRDATVGTPKAGDNDTRAHQRDTSPHLQTLGDAFRAQGIKPRDLGRIVKK